MYAQRGQGKTTYIFDMAAKNAKLGHTVLFVSLEMDTDDIINDLARRYAGITIEEEYNYEIPSRKKLAFDKKYNEIKEITNLKLLGIRRGDNLDWEVIKEVIKTQEGADLIIVDNMGRIGKRQNENEYDKQNRVTDSIMSFTSAENIPVILLHHRRKSQSTTGKGMDEMSGSGKIADGADMVVRVKRNTDPEAKGGDKYETTLFLEKARGYPEEIHSIFFNKGTFDDKYHIDLDKLFNR